jgi:glycosyltransferase involved in cell wall biosynthesis
MAVLDHITAPLIAEQQLVAAEHERYPDWAPAWELDDATRAFARRQHEECVAADLVVCLSSFARKVLVDQGVPAEKMVVIPPALLGTPAPDQAIARRTERLEVLFVGNDPMRKGLPDLVEAARLLDSRRFRFRAIGVSDLTAHGREQTQRWVEIVGSMPRTEMLRQYLQADVLAFPTVSETFGIVILEAMRAAMVVITTSHGGGPDVIRDGIDGFLVPIHSPEAIAERLERLAANPRLREEMGRNARRRAEEFSVERYADQLAAALKRVSPQHASVEN